MSCTVSHCQAPIHKGFYKTQYCKDHTCSEGGCLHPAKPETRRCHIHPERSTSRRSRSRARSRARSQARALSRVPPELAQYAALAGS